VANKGSSVRSRGASVGVRFILTSLSWEEKAKARPRIEPRVSLIPEGHANRCTTGPFVGGITSKSQQRIERRVKVANEPSFRPLTN